MPDLSKSIKKRRLKTIARAISAMSLTLLLSSCASLSDLSADFLALLNESDEVAIKLPPAPQPRYEGGDTFVFEVRGVQIVETVTEVSKDVVYWTDDNGNTWATLHDPILQPISEIEISRRYSKAALSVFPLQKGRKITFTVFEMLRDGSERRRVETCEVEGAFRLTVKSGEFDTYKIRCKRRNYYETLYYAPRVGHVVKFVREGGLGDEVFELVTYRKKADQDAENLAKAKEKDEDAFMQEEKELEEEILEEKKEDKEFAEAKKEMEEAIARDQSGDMANAGPSSGAFKLRFDKEILAINERVHSVSQRVEKLSERVHNLAQRLEFLPSRLAALEMAKKKVEQVLEMPKSPVKLAQDSKSPYWGVQVGAYKTKPGAKIAWSEILSNPAAIELNDAIVKYVEMTRKNGSKIYRIIVNNYASRKAASAACKSFKSNGVDCYTVHIK